MHSPLKHKPASIIKEPGWHSCLRGAVGLWGWDEAGLEVTVTFCVTHLNTAAL